MAYQPKSYRKFVATAATATLVAGVLAPAVSAASFTDVPERYQDAVDFVVSKGVQGFSDTQFGTGENIKRVDAAVMVAKVVGLDTESAPAAGFTDVPARAQGAVNALKAAGITSGKSTTSFGAQDLITRGELAIWIDRAFNLDGSADHNFTDVADRYAEAVEALVANKITNGVSATQFGVTQNAKRGDFAIFLHRASNIDLTPEVVEVSAANAKELQIVFNQAVKKDTVIDNNNKLVSGVVKLNSTDASTLVDNASLSEDGKTLTLYAINTWDGSYAAEVVKDKVETVSGEKVAEYKAFVSVKDTTRPTFSGVTYEPSGAAKFTFSEPLNETATTIAQKLVVSGGTSVSIAASDITLSADKKSFTVVLPASMTKDASYTFTFTGLQDFAGNLSSSNPVSATVVKSDRDTTKPSVTEVVALDTAKLQVTFSEKIQSAGAKVTVDNATYSTYTLDSTGTVATFTNVSNLTAGVKTVTVADAKDLAGLTMDAVARVIQVSADTTAPAYVSHTVETDGAKRFLVVNYNEEVVANTTKQVTGTYVDSSSITRNITPITGAAITTGSDKKSVKIQLPSEAGTYNVTLPTGLVEDTSAATNDSAAKYVSFTVGAPVDTTKPVLNGFVQNGNKVTVTFDRDVTAATALNVSNYTIDGISSPFESAIFKGDARTVELTLKKDVISTNGTRNYTVSNVATSAGSVMDSKTDKYEFKENIRPTVVSAKVLSATTIEVTLSEAVDAATVGTDFDVFQGTSTTALTDSEAISSNNKKVVITLSNPLESLSGLALKPSSTINLTDVNGNLVNFAGPLAITN